MAEDRTQSGRVWLWIGSSFLLIAVFFAARYLLRDRLPVREAQATRAELINTVPTNGRVEPEVNYQIVSPVATTVKAVYAQQGDQVAAGKVLMVLDDVEARARLATAKSGVKAAEAAFEAATHNGTQAERQAADADITRGQLDRDQTQHDLDALVRLQSTGAASAGEVAAARQRLETAKANLHASDQSARNRYSPVEVERARAALADAEANLAAAQQIEAKLTIRAPIAGTVYAVNVGRTEFVEEGKLLVEVADLHRLRVRAYFDEPEIGRLAVGQSIQIKWDAKPELSWRGHIIRIPSTVITYGTRNVGEVLVGIDVTTAKEENALTIPREALHSENGKPYVYKVIGNRLVRTPVVTGTPSLTQAPILSGLKEGDWVATGTTNGLPLQEGIPIQVKRP
jgi:HlyD family secretion protein